MQYPSTDRLWRGRCCILWRSKNRHRELYCESAVRPRICVCTPYALQKTFGKIIIKYLVSFTKLFGNYLFTKKLVTVTKKFGETRMVNFTK
jgi:hypothetical protein